MGLGLFLVRLVAERYGGRFELSSTVGVGTKSTLVIPETLEDARALPVEHHAHDRSVVGLVKPRRGIGHTIAGNHHLAA